MDPKEVLKMFWQTDRRLFEDRDDQLIMHALSCMMAMHTGASKDQLKIRNLTNGAQYMQFLTIILGSKICNSSQIRISSMPGQSCESVLESTVSI